MIQVQKLNQSQNTIKKQKIINLTMQKQKFLPQTRNQILAFLENGSRKSHNKAKLSQIKKGQT